MLENLKDAARDWLGPSPNARPEPAEPRIDDLSLQYSYQDLYTATKGFAPETRLGAGAAGAVYRGTLRGGTEVAVKVLLDAGGLGGFEDEVRVLSRVRHPNLVTLLGWGHKDGAKYLVYELLTGGDVSKKLEKCKKEGAPFTWSERLRVAHDSARGLSHMMNSDPKTFHRDIKPANIMLENGGGAKMADFGLASTIRDSRQHLTVDQISGTPGYACPSYIRTGQVSEASEVYSFGIVLLELLLNQPPALAGPQGDIVYPLLQIVQPNVPGAHARVLQAMDRRAGWPSQVVDEFVDHAISCVHMIPERRPNFENVVRVLRHLSNKTGGPPASRGPQPQPQLMMPGLGMPAPGPAPAIGGLPGMPGAPWAGGGLAGAGGYAGAGASPSHRGSGQGYGAHGGSAGRSSVPPAPGGKSTSGASSSSTELAEVVLEAVSADGIDLGPLSRGHKAIAFAVDPAKGRLSFVVGREYQPDFFERMVLKQDQRTTISRAHFEMAWEPPASAPTLRKLSGNPLLVDDRPQSSGEAKTVPDGTRLGFAKTEDGQRFLVLRVTLRSRGAVKADGQHPAVALSLRRSTLGAGGGSAIANMSTIKPNMSVVAVLECVKSAGCDPSKLPSDERSVPIPFEEQVDVGRHHQPPNFFEQLLQGDSRWLTFISRTHCRLLLQRLPDAGAMATASGYGLRVENLSTNAICVKKANSELRRLGKGRTEMLSEGERLVFVANPGGSDGEVQFLEFLLRRARGTT